MLQITVPGVEVFDESKGEFGEFVNVEKEQPLILEHSLVSVSKWEAKWCKPFLAKTTEKTLEETIDYVRCMTLTQNVKPEVYNRLSDDNIKAVQEYLEAPMTATWFSDDKTASPNREIITSELVYYWMIALEIPFECQKWHLNRLLTLIRICNIKNKPQKKMSQKEVIEKYAALNEARKKQLHTTG